MKKKASQKKSGLFSLLRPKAPETPAIERFEGLLETAPAGYCVWDANDKVMSSPGFREMVGLQAVTCFEDIQNQINPEEKIQAAQNFGRLTNGGFPFIQTVHIEGRTIRLTGQSAHSDRIIWAEDITDSSTTLVMSMAENERLDLERARFEGGLDAIPRAVWFRDAQQNIIWCNAMYGRAVGEKPAEAVKGQLEIGQSSRKKKSEDGGMQPGREMAKAAFDSGETQRVRSHVIIDGDRLLMNIVEIPLKDLNMTVGLALNITREEELEAELKRFESANRDLLEQLGTAIGIFDTDTKLEFYNSAWAQLWDLDDQWLNTHPTLSDIMEKLRETRRLPEQADFRKFKQSWLAMFTGLIDPHEDMLYLPDGAALRMLAVPNPMGGVMMTFEDVTSRLELESSYNTLIAVQKETLDNLDEAVAVYGGDGRLKLWNPSFSRMWGLHPEDLEGEPHITRTVDKLKNYFEESNWKQQREDLIALGLDRVMHEGRFERADESLIDYITVPLPDGGVLLTCTDVTDNVRVENALREKAAALEAAEQLKLDFLANVSYQLRTPLNAIMGFTEILDQQYFGPLNDRQKQYTHDMSQASHRLLELINDILDLSTIEAGYLDLELSDIKICEMLEGLVSLVDEWGRKKGLKISLECAKNIGAMQADEPRLKQAIVNLIRNSIAYTPDGGSITVSAKRRKDGIEIAVIDTGIGISKEDQQRILQPFARAAARFADKRIERGGAGLGLSLVNSIVALHGGTLEIESAPGKGTTVTILFPFEIVKKKAA